MGLALSKHGRSATLLFRRSGELEPEPYTAAEVAAVLRRLNRSYRCQQVWLQLHKGGSQLLDRGWGAADPPVLMELADDVAQTLGVPIRDDELPWLTL